MMLIYSVVLLHAMIFTDNTSLMRSIAVVRGMDDPTLPCYTAAQLQAVILTDSTNLVYSIGGKEAVVWTMLYCVVLLQATILTA